MSFINVQKVHPRATFARQHPDDAGYDLTCTSIRFDESSQLWIANLGIKTEFSPKFYAMLALRSSTAIRGWRLANGVAIIDAGYRGEWAALLEFRSMHRLPVLQKDMPILTAVYEEIGRPLLNTRIAQAIILPCPDTYVNFVDSLNPSARAEGGFGSTGA